jgi:hypothetical protein
VSRQFSKENRRGHQLTNLMVRSAQKVNWYSNIHTGHNVLILRKKSGTQQPFGLIGAELAACTVQFKTSSTLTPRIECYVKFHFSDVSLLPYIQFIHAITKEMVFD